MRTLCKIMLGIGLLFAASNIRDEVRGNRIYMNHKIPSRTITGILFVS
jgi:hypothetical protein